MVQMCSIVQKVVAVSAIILQQHDTNLTKEPKFFHLDFYFSKITCQFYKYSKLIYDR